jgi:hypothetical protein
MAITKIDYFYDRQQVRYLEQIVRAFSGYQYMTGRRGDLEPELKSVPCRMAITNEVVANIIRNQSESALNVCPMITVFQTGLRFSREDLQNPTHESTVQVTERHFDEQTGQYTGDRGRSYSVRRLMPLPFEMTIQVDLWTSNWDQKQQILEQIGLAIYPDFQIQNSENPLDWGAITLCTPDPDLTLSSRSIPIGSSDEIDIASITLKIKFWLSPPALVTEQKLIERVITNMTDSAPIPGVIMDGGDMLSTDMGYVVETLGNHSVMISGNRMKLLGPKASEVDENGDPYSWRKLISTFGVLRPAASQILLTAKVDDRTGILGTIEYTNDPSVLYWSIDPMTLPSNTLPPIDAVINPMETYPNQKLPPEVNGQRYLLLNDIGGVSQAWGALTAKENDIIQYVNNHWEVVFSAATSPDEEFVVNNHNNKQLKWVDGEWILPLEGVFSNALWRLIL